MGSKAEFLKESEDSCGHTHGVPYDICAYCERDRAEKAEANLAGAILARDQLRGEAGRLKFDLNRERINHGGTLADLDKMKSMVREIKEQQGKGMDVLASAAWDRLVEFVEEEDQ